MATQASEQFSISSLLQKTQQNNPYNWIGVLEFLHQQHKQMQLKESEWALEKSLMQSRVKELEGVMQGLEKVVTDLGRRCKMLEVALRQERIKHQRGGTLQHDFVGQLLQENIDHQQLGNMSTVPKRKARPYRPLLQKILQEVGIQSIFSPPGSPRAEQSNRPSVLMQTPNQTVQNANSNSGRQSPLNRTNMNSTSGFPTSQANSFSFLNSKPKTATHIRVQNQELPEQKEPLIPKAQLTNHFDGVRDAYFFQSIMVTVSEDCQLRLWDMQDDFHSVQPYLAIREHTGPIFAVSGYETHQHKLNSPYVLFSAGADGVVNVWSAPACEDVQQNGPTEPYQQCLTSWSAHQDAIWQLRVNTQEGLLLSGGADGFVKLWSINNEILSHHEPKPAMQYSTRQDSCTALQWLGTSFVCGFMGTPMMQVFDVETPQGKVLQTIKYQGDHQQSQINSIICHQSQLVTGSEDAKIRIFDLNSGRITNQIVAHEDAVTGIALNLPATLAYSVSHDGHLKAWDIRKLQNCYDNQIHNPKHDEAIHNVVHHPSLNVLVTCGADSIAKIFTTKT